MLRGYESAAPGEIVTMLFTGRGSSDLPVAVTIGGVPADIVELAPSSDVRGYHSVKFRVPANPHLRDGLARVSLSIGAAFSQTGVLLRVAE